jgi:hypothetical protein
LRFISLSLRRTVVRLAPRDSRALTLAFLRSRPSGRLFTSSSILNLLHQQTFEKQRLKPLAKAHGVLESAAYYNM